MSRVGIVTFHNSDNYGAILQAYGLAKAIESIGHQALIIDYLSADERGGHLRQSLRMLLHPRIFLFGLVRRWRFRRFREQYLPLTDQHYATVEKLRTEPPAVDVLLCGSDQVWNIHVADCGDSYPVFFLDFGTDAMRRVSYAPCIGDMTLAELHKTAGPLLQRFTHLSARDLQTQAAIFELTGREATHVLDPCFLTDFSPFTQSPSSTSPYCFAYLLGKTTLIEHSVHLIEKVFGMPVVSRAAGPLQWLSLIRYADFVLTDSFHGVCFALIWKKNFAALPARAGRQFRIEDLLHTVRLQNRLVLDEKHLMRAIAMPADHEVATVHLEKARCRSLGFLRNALS